MRLATVFLRGKHSRAAGRPGKMATSTSLEIAESDFAELVRQHGVPEPVRSTEQEKVHSANGEAIVSTPLKSRMTLLASVVGLLVVVGALGVRERSLPAGRVRPQLQLREVESKEAFDAVLRADQAVLFVWGPSIYCYKSEDVVRAWVRRCTPRVEVYRVDFSQQRYVIQWLDALKRSDLLVTGRGAVIWLRSGAIIHDEKYPNMLKPRDLQRETREAFGSELKHE